MSQNETLTLNGSSYAMADLSSEARSLVRNVQLVDAEIERLQQQVAIFQTARNAYLSGLKNAVNKPAVALIAAEKPAAKPRKAK